MCALLHATTPFGLRGCPRCQSAVLGSVALAGNHALPRRLRSSWDEQPALRAVRFNKQTNASAESRKRFLSRKKHRRADYMQPHELVSLSGAVAVVTGGGRGIGQAIVTRLAAMEATVILTGRDEARVQQVARDLEARGHRAEGIGCDVTNLASVEALGERLRKSYGRVDILVNNAGIGGPSGLLHELAPEDWDAIFHPNLPRV